MKIDDISKYGVAESIIKKLKDIGFIDLTEIQELAVSKGLFEGKNMVISSPTNTGKTFIAELAALNAYKQRKGGRTFYLVPLKALAEEKFAEFHDKYSEWGLKVAISTSERAEFDEELLNFDLIIATYEKLNALVIRYPDIVKGIGLVIVDEIQNMGDPSRGIGLEFLLTKIVRNDKATKPNIIGLSATIPNDEDIAQWLKAELIKTDKRGVELREGILYTGDSPLSFKGKNLTSGDFLYKEFNTGQIEVEKLDLNDMEILSKVCKDEQLIIFENTRRRAEDLAVKLSQQLPTAERINEFVSEMEGKIEPTPSFRQLKKCMVNSVAFHHAGMLHEEKRIIQKAFEEGNLKVICTTTTLGAGVNTPAKNVVILSHTLYNDTPIQVRDYKNMAGRAGRIRYCDNFGRSVLLANSEKELDMLWESYVNAQPELIKSRISEKENLAIHILGLITSQSCKTVEEVLNFLKDTFFGYIYYQTTHSAFKPEFEKSIVKQIENMKADDFLKTQDNQIIGTELGKRCAEGLLSPESAKLIYSSLKKVEKKYTKKPFKAISETLLQLSCSTRDSRLLFTPRSDQEKKEIWIYWDQSKSKYVVEYDESESEAIYRTTKTLQLLLRWIEGIPYSDLRNFAHQGDIKGISETMSWILRGVKKIAEKPLFNFGDDFMESLTLLCDRVLYGVPTDAVEIMKLKVPAIHRFRAMQLAKRGYTTLSSLIQASIDDLKQVEGIGEILAHRIKEHCEQWIEDKTTKGLHYHTLRAKDMGRDSNIIERLYKETGDSFARVCCEILKKHIGISCQFIGDVSEHEPDGLMELKEGKIVIECKRKQGKELVNAKEAEEILGKGAKYKPIANVVIGYPDFSDPAIKNASHTNITLVTHAILADILIAYWKSSLTTEKIVDLLKRGTYIHRKADARRIKKILKE